MYRLIVLVKWLCTVTALLLGLTHKSSTSFSIVDTPGKEFKVLIGKLIVLHHTPQSPVLFIGKGNTQFEELSGNFFIHDYVSSRLPMSDYTITHHSEDSCSIRFSSGKESATMHLSTEDKQPLSIDVLMEDPLHDRVWLRLVAQPDEKVYGGGEQFSYFNLRHRDGSHQNVFPIWTSEQGVGRNKSDKVTFIADNLERSGGDYYTTYFPQPSFVSSRNYFFHHAGTNYAVLDFRFDSFHEIYIQGKPGRMYISPSSTMMGVVTSLTSLLGKMPRLPAWVQGGAILAMQGGTDVMLARYKYAKDNNIPVAGLWIQDWSGEQRTPFGKRVNWNWQWDPEYYPGLDKVIQDLIQEDVRVLGYINPNLDSRGSLFKEGASKGFLVKNSTGGVYLMSSLSFRFGSVDLTNPKAFDWYKEVIKKDMVSLGLGGWMADFGEYLPVDAVLYSGQRGQDVHNDYPRLWAMLNKMALEETRTLGEVFFFSRAGFSGISNASTLMWAGDQNVDFSYADGIRSAIVGALSMAMSGTGLTHFDLGGYTTFGAMGLRRTEELLLRSSELAIFGPVFRAHEGNQAQSNVQWYTNTTTKAFARLAKAFAALKEYRVYVTEITSRDGVPAQRPFILHHSELQAPDTQFFFGPDILVAPVFESQVESVDVVFPPCPGFKWTHIWSGKEFDGDQTVTIEAPVGFPAAFYKSNSLFKSVFQQFEGNEQIENTLFVVE